MPFACCNAVNRVSELADVEIGPPADHHRKEVAGVELGGPPRQRLGTLGVALKMNGSVASTRICGDSGSSSIARAPSAIASSKRPWKPNAMPN